MCQFLPTLEGLHQILFLLQFLQRYCMKLPNLKIRLYNQKLHPLVHQLMENARVIYNAWYFYLDKSSQDNMLRKNAHDSCEWHVGSGLGAPLRSGAVISGSEFYLKGLKCASFYSEV
eukprot:c22259_g1_i1 orf=117-467(+)